MDISLRNDYLEKATETVKEYLNDHPTLYKIALIVNHIFRAVSMGFFMMALPFSAPVSLAICAAASLFYRLTVEGNCTYKFALPAFAGALALQFASIIPLTCYVAYIVLTVNDDVDQNCTKFHSCCK